MPYDEDGNDKPKNDKPKNIGAMWEKDGNAGPFMSGNIIVDGVEIRFICFRNKYHKDGDNRPTWHIFPSKPKAQREDRPQPKPQAEEKNEGQETF